MPKFKYKIIKKSGANKSGTIEASSTAEAKSKLSAGGDMVMSLSEVAGSGGKKVVRKSAKKGGSVGLSLGKIIKEEELTVFTRQLHPPKLYEYHLHAWFAYPSHENAPLVLLDSLLRKSSVQSLH